MQVYLLTPIFALFSDGSYVSYNPALKIIPLFVILFIQGNMENPPIKERKLEN